MKYFLLCLLAFPALACSELGPMEFQAKPETVMKCGKLATAYAVDFSRSMLSHEAKKNAPAKLSPPARGAPSLFHTLKSSHLMGYNVSLTDGKNECTFCVDLVLEGENCRIQSIQKFMCDF